MTPTTTESARLSKKQLFVKLGYTPHEGQLAVHRSKALRRILACGSRWGKSLCAAMEACAALLEPRDQALGWLVAPTRDLVDRIFLRVVDTLKAKFPARILQLDLRSQRIVVTNLGGGRSELRGKSADFPTSLLGEEVDFMIIDEAARLKEEIWTSFLSQRLVNRKGWALLLSTPVGCDWFFRLYRRGQKNRDPECKSWQSPSTANPHLDPGVLEAERARVSKEVFEQEYEARFLGAEIEPCDTCGGPSRSVTGHIMLFEGEEQLMCPECGKDVDKNGRTVWTIWHDGRPYLNRVIFEREEHSATMQVRRG